MADNTCNSRLENQNVSNLKRFLNDDLKQIPKSKAKSKDVVKIAHQLTFLTNKRKPDFDSQHILTVDTACPTALCGAKLFKSLYKSYPQAVSSSFIAEPSSKRFMFGGGETTTSLGKYTFPVYIMDDRDDLHSVNITMEVVEQDIVMLFKNLGL